MRSHRLDRLAKLTKGVALVGLGLTEAACGGEPRVNSPHKDEKPNVNTVVMEDAGTSAAPAPSGSTVVSDVGPGMPVHMNAPSPSASTLPAPPTVNTVKPPPKK